MRRGLKMLSTGLVITFALGTTGVVYAAEASTNQCWGDIASQLAQRGQMGQHSSSHSVFTPNPGEGGREGVGNQSRLLAEQGRIETGEPGQGGNGLHAIANGALVGFIDPVTGGPGSGDPILCDGTPGNPPPDTP